MEPADELRLFESLGRIEAKLDATNDALATHTAQDAENFHRVEADLEVLKLNAAKSAGVTEEAARHAGAAGGKMGAIIGGAISITVAALSTYFGK